jgi:tetratricopeptide (TPR) repeat protein
VRAGQSLICGRAGSLIGGCSGENDQIDLALTDPGRSFRGMRVPVFVASVVLTLATVPAMAAPSSVLDGNAIPGKNRYERCLTLTKSNAEKAAEAAETWHEAGGGAAALHCEALALVALHRYAEAAEKLDQAAMAADTHNIDLRVALFDQAGNAWLLAEQPQKAETSINSALALAPRDEDMLFDRARARAANRNWPGAESDLRTLLAIDHERADAYVLRASARHAEGKKADALSDLGRAMQIYPDYPEALVERGSMRFEAGDMVGARADWTMAARASPNSDAGAAARARLADMDAAAARPQGN